MKWGGYLMIAVHTRAMHATIVTNNQAHFTRIRGLNIENWSPVNAEHPTP